MASYYRVKLELDGPLATPFHSGTFFGHLCWAYRALKSEESLGRWLSTMGDDPFLLSDGLPADCLPRPLVRPQGRAGRMGLEELNRVKELKKRRHIRRGLFEALRGAMSEGALLGGLFTNDPPAGTRRERQAHNTIDRRTGRTPETGGLYFTEASWPGSESTTRTDSGGFHWDVYVKTSLDKTALGEMMGLVGKWGYGKDASVGRGRFTSTIEDESAGFFEQSGPRRMSLSHGTLTPEMNDARYRLHTHYGKTGGVYAMGSSPFKYPLTLVEPGATFAAAGDGPFGAMLSGVHPTKPWIRHNAWHLTLSYTEATE